MPNTAVDIVVILIILISACLAFVRGFIREALALGTWLLAIYLGFTQYQLATPYVQDKIDNPMMRDFVGGLIIFGLVMLVLVPIGFYVRTFIKGDQITSVDRSFGFVFGAARGFLLLSIFYLIISWLMPEEKQPAWLKEANTRPVLVYGADIIRSVIPQEQRDMMEKKAKESSDEIPDLTGEPKSDSHGPVELKGNQDAYEKIIEGVKKGP